MRKRINERNTGKYSLESNLKNRKEALNKELTFEDKQLAKAVLKKVYECLKYDKELSNCGHLSQEAIFTDGGRFVISMKRSTFEKLDDLINKL
jgi:hypothetical protein